METNASSSALRYVLVVALDGTPGSDPIVDEACMLARAIPNTELHLVHAVEPSETEGFPVQDARDRAMDRGRRYLDEIARAIQARSGVTVVGHLHESLAAPAILRTAASTNADLVLVGTHDRRGLSHWAYGSVGERVTRDAACPVMVVRPKHHATSRVPEIEPPCADCLRVQRETKSATLWCARHSVHHPHPHLHYSMPESFGAGSSLVSP